MSMALRLRAPDEKRLHGKSAVKRGIARAFAADHGGNVAVIFAIVVPVLLMVVGGGIDYAFALREKALAQKAADAASIAGAKEMSLTDANRNSVPAVVAAVVDAYLAANTPPPQSSSAQTASPYAVTTTISDASATQMTVAVSLNKTVKSKFGLVSALGDVTIRANSVAVVVGKPNLCLLALDPSAMGTLYLQKNAKIVGQNCGVYSNSTHPNGIKAFQSSMLTATVICSAGGHAGGHGNFQPAPYSDCPQFVDPLSGRPEPSVGGCDATNLVVKNQTITLGPGTYCGGIAISGTAKVTFSPGIYIMSNGPLKVTETAAISGVYTGFFFTGAGAKFSFATGTSVSLTAPKDGTMAGMLFFASRSQTNVVHEILSDNARQLLGTIYLPTGLLSIDANQPIADQSAYTAIVALQVTANSGPTVTLNTNYDTTDVPVPQGIRGAGQPVALVQ